MTNYDVIFSIGPSCKVAQYLKSLNLRKCAYPLDWQICNDFDRILHLFESDFSDFFIEYKNLDNDYKLSGLRSVEDIRNKIVSMHHISDDLPLDEGVKKFRSKMLKRYFRLKSHIQNGNNILIIANYDVSIDDLVSFLKSFASLFEKKNIVMVNVKDSKIEEKNEYYLDNNLKIVEYLINDVHENGSDPKTNRLFWLGNTKRWLEIISELTASIGN